MRKTILILCIACALASCSVDEGKNFTEINESAIPTEVSIDDALKTLESALSSLSGDTKSSVWNKTVADISTLTMSDCFHMTKSSSQEPFDKLLYIVNFEEGGSAVLGADTRLDPLLVITEETLITKTDFTQYPQAVPAYTRSDLFCEEDQEYYIGNNSTDLPHSVFIMDYLENAVSHAPYDGSDDSDDYAYAFSATVVGMTYLMTKWHQDDPYNGKIRRSWLSGDRCPAGCTTIALVQMLVYNKDIPISKFSISESTWDDLDRNSIYRITTSDQEKQEENDRLVNDVSTLVKSVANGIGVSYNFLFTGGTFATPAKVMKYMRRIGYSSADKIDKFSLPTITNTLTAGKPVFIAALSPSLSGHAWVIDGYVTQIATHKETGEQKEQLLLHCNWGWGGADDGYYIPKLFDNPQWLDDPHNVTSGGNGFDSSWWYRIITY